MFLPCLFSFYLVVQVEYFVQKQNICDLTCLSCIFVIVVAVFVHLFFDCRLQV